MESIKEQIEKLGGTVIRYFEFLNDEIFIFLYKKKSFVLTIQRSVFGFIVCYRLSSHKDMLTLTDINALNSTLLEKML